MLTQIKEIIKDGKTAKIYTGLLDSIDSYESPHQFISKAYNIYLKENPVNPALNGRIFEYLVCETLKREGITPFYYQAAFSLVPEADFDLVCYDPVQPVVLSMKVSLRERWKQADHEGLILKQVYRKSESYLITLSNVEAVNISKKISGGNTSGLNGCIVASQSKYTEFLTQLKKRCFSIATEVQPLIAQGLIK